MYQWKKLTADRDGVSEESIVYHVLSLNTRCGTSEVVYEKGVAGLATLHLHDVERDVAKAVIRCRSNVDSVILVVGGKWSAASLVVRSSILRNLECVWGK